MKSVDLAAITVSGPELAELLGVTPRRIQQLEAEGRVERVGRGRYALATSVRGVVAQLSAAAAGRGEASLASARARLAEARAVQEERRNALDAGTLIDTGALDYVLSETMINLRKMLRAIPERAPTLVPGFTLEMRKPLLVLIDATLREIASGKILDRASRPSVRKDAQAQRARTRMNGTPALHDAAGA